MQDLHNVFEDKLPNIQFTGLIPAGEKYIHHLKSLSLSENRVEDPAPEQTISNNYNSARIANVSCREYRTGIFELSLNINWEKE